MPELLVEVLGIGKDFPGVHALVDCRFDLYPGEVHALVGEHGAGKSDPDENPRWRVPARLGHHPHQGFAG